MHSTLDVCYSGDVADDRFFHKTNDSDATQFYFLYPRIGPHSLHPSYCYPCQFTLIYLRFFFSMGDVLGNFFNQCVGGLCYLGYYGFQGAASSVLEANPLG